MIRKTVSVLVVLLVGTYLWKHTDLGNYVRTMWDDMWASAKSSEPLEFKIKRASDMLKQMDKEIEKVRHDVALKETDRDSLFEKVAQQALVVEACRQDLTQRNEKLKLNLSEFTYEKDKKKYTRESFAADLDKRFDRLQQAESLHAQLQRSLGLQNQALAAAEERYEELKQKIVVWREQLRTFEMELDAIKAAELRNKYASRDNGRTDRTTKLFNEIDRELKVRRNENKRIEKEQPQLADEPPLAAPVKPNAKDLSERIDGHLGAESKYAVSGK